MPLPGNQAFALHTDFVGRRQELRNGSPQVGSNRNQFINRCIIALDKEVDLHRPLTVIEQLFLIWESGVVI